MNGAIQLTLRPKAETRRLPDSGPMLLVVIAIFTSVVTLAYSGEAAVQVLLPALSGICLYSLFASIIWKRSGTLPISDLGVFYGLVITMYSFMPLFGYLLKGMKYGIDADPRLRHLAPQPADIAHLGWQGFTYLCCFAGVYILAGGGKGIGRLRGRLKHMPPIWLLITIVVLLQGYFMMLGILYPRRVETYADSYLARAELPLFIRQITNVLTDAVLIANVMLLVGFFSDYKKYRLWIAALLGYHFFETITTFGSRSELVTFILIAIMLYHRMVRPLRLVFVLGMMFLGLAGILAFGVMRTAFWTGQEFEAKEMWKGSNEFESIFATSVELNHLREKGLPKIPYQLYWDDLFALVPSQLMPIQKMRFDVWYLQTFHPELHKRGEGRCFGALAEAAVGFGIWDLIVRASVLGGLAAWAHRKYQRRQDGFWMTTLYLWLCILCYLSFRVSSFGFVQDYFYRFVPIYFGVSFLHYVFQRNAGVSQEMVPAT